VPAFTAAGLIAIPLTDSDAPALQSLFERCADYFNLAEGHSPGPDAALHELHDRPPDCPPENIHCLGLYDGAIMNGVICALCQYPAESTWYLGLMLLDPTLRAQGHGAALYAAFETYAAALGAKTILLAVLEANHRAAAFWERQNFAFPRAYPARPFGNRRHIIIEYEKRLAYTPIRAI
jgi:GNAT superfamily N-acetyltransferase